MGAMEIIALMFFLYFSNFIHNADFSSKVWRTEDSGRTIFTIKQTGQTLLGLTSLALQWWLLYRKSSLLCAKKQFFCFAVFPFGCQRD